MATRRGQGGNGQTPRNTRVYAPTHRAGNEQPTRDEQPQRGTQPARSKQKEAPRPTARPQRGGQPQRGEQPQRGTQPPRDGRQPARSTVLHAPQVQEPPARKRREEARPTARKQQKRPTARKTGYDSHRVEHVARKDEQARKQAQRAQRREERLQRRAQRPPMDRNTILALLIAVVVLAGLLLAGYFVFLVEDIVVDGNDRYSESSIVSLSGLVAGRHMLLSNLEAAQKALEENAYIKVIGIERELPRTIRITIAERAEAASIAVQDSNVIIDIEGHVLTIGEGSNPEALLRITGISQLGFRVNQQLGPGSDIQIKALLLILEQLVQAELREDIVGIDLTNPLRLTMQTREGVTVVLGQSDNLPEKMQWLKNTLPSLRAGGVTRGTLDVSAKGGAIYSPPAAPGSGQPATPVTPATPTDPSDPDTQDPDTQDPDPQDPDPPDPEQDPG